MTIRPRHSNPRRIVAIIKGRPGAWTSRAPGGGGAVAVSAGAPTSPRAGRKIDGRRPDGYPNPQAFSLPQIQTYPRRTAICRECPELELIQCARGCCRKLSRGHAFILNAIADGDCPLGKFTEEL